MIRGIAHLPQHISQLNSDTTAKPQYCTIKLGKLLIEIRDKYMTKIVVRRAQQQAQVQVVYRKDAAYGEGCSAQTPLI